MPIDPGAVGNTSGPWTAEWDGTDAILYALGVGAGTGELAFTTENTEGVRQRVLPTFALVAGASLEHALPGVGEFDLAQLVHGEQHLTLHRDLPVAGRAELRARIAAIYDKGTAAVVVTETDAVGDDGEPLFSTRSASFIRGEGGWGGDRGPSGPRPVPPERPPDHTVTYRTSPDQALLYRLSGDRNRLHSDPAFAAAGGFDRPILHGLCTYGFAGRALLHALCDGEPDRFGGMGARFTAPVLPGDELTTRIWRDGEGAHFDTTRTDGTVVLAQGRFHAR